MIIIYHSPFSFRACGTPLVLCHAAIICHLSRSLACQWRVNHGVHCCGCVGHPARHRAVRGLERQPAVPRPARPAERPTALTSGDVCAKQRACNQPPDSSPKSSSSSPAAAAASSAFPFRPPSPLLS